MSARVFAESAKHFLSGARLEYTQDECERCARALSLFALYSSTDRDFVSRRLRAYCSLCRPAA